MFLLSALILAATVLFLLATATPAPASSRVSRIDEAVEIVRGRYARSEIDAAEYHRLVTALTRPE
jgi:uncharacterized membrane protein